MKKLIYTFCLIFCFCSLANSDGVHTYDDEAKAKVDSITVEGGDTGDALIQDGNGNFVPTPLGAVSVTNANVEDAITAGSTVTTTDDSSFFAVIYNGVMSKISLTSLYSEIADGLAGIFEPAKGENDNFVTDTEKANLHAPASDNQVGDGVTITGAGTVGDPFVSVAGSGDVTGPASAVAGNVPQLDATGKVLSDSGVAASSILTEEVDGSTTNEINTFTADTGGTTSGLAVSIIGSGAITTERAGDTITINASSVETDPIVGAKTGLIKADGAGNISAAVAGTDYQAPLVSGTDYEPADSTILKDADIGVNVQAYSANMDTDSTDDLALGELSGNAYRGDRGKTAYDHSQAAHAPAGAEENPALMSQAEAEAGTDENERVVSALRLKQAIDTHAGGGTDDQTAAEVSYSNTTSGITATNTQAAIDEIEGRADTLESNNTGTNSGDNAANSTYDTDSDGDFTDESWWNAFTWDFDGDDILDDSIDEDSIDFGTGTDQIDASDIPIQDTDGNTEFNNLEDSTAELYWLVTNLQASLGEINANGINWTAPKTADYTASNKDGVIVDATSGNITVTILAGAVGNAFLVVDGMGKAETNVIAVATADSTKINSSTADLILDTDGDACLLVYVNSTIGYKTWRIMQ